MTREQAIFWLRQYRRKEVYQPTSNLFGQFWKNSSYEFMKTSYERSLIPELIDRIKHSSKDPIEVVRDFYYWMDDMVCESEEKSIWDFASTMENICSDILHYLREKERNDHA